MAEEDEFRQLLHDLSLVHCPFAKTILNNHFACQYSHRHLLAGREIAGCKHPDAQVLCNEMLFFFRRSATFALKIRDKGALPHGKAIRIQVGGLRGLLGALPEQTENNIFELVETAIAHFEDISNIPTEPIVQSISQFKGRRKR